LVVKLSIIGICLPALQNGDKDYRCLTTCTLYQYGSCKRGKDFLSLSHAEKEGLIEVQTKAGVVTGVKLTKEGTKKWRTTK